MLLKQGEDEEIIEWSAVAMYGGGSDTVCPRKVLEYIETYVGLRSPCIRISLLCLYTLKLSAEKGNKKKGLTNISPI